MGQCYQHQCHIMSRFPQVRKLGKKNGLGKIRELFFRFTKSGNFFSDLQSQGTFFSIYKVRKLSFRFTKSGNFFSDLQSQETFFPIYKVRELFFRFTKSGNFFFDLQSQGKVRDFFQMAFLWTGSLYFVDV